ncbi:MAG: hypothetical protein ACJ762_06560 [Solirubrobacteraceae bacterium]
MRTGLAVLAGAGALVAGGQLLHRPAPSTTPSVGSHRPPPVVLGSAPAHSDDRRREPDSPPEDAAQPEVRPAPHAATAAAARFVTAYLRWQDGDRGGEVREALRDTSDERLWRLLRSGRGQPDPHPRQTSSELSGVTAGTAGGLAATVVANVGQATRVAGLALVLRHRDQGWVVSSVGP